MRSRTGKDEKKEAEEKKKKKEEKQSLIKTSNPHLAGGEHLFGLRRMVLSQPQPRPDPNPRAASPESE